MISDSVAAGVNGAGKTTQLQIITGSLEADSGEILKQKVNMKIAYLTQEFDVEPSRTVRVSCSARVLIGSVGCPKGRYSGPTDHLKPNYEAGFSATLPLSSAFK